MAASALKEIPALVAALSTAPTSLRDDAATFFENLLTDSESGIVADFSVLLRDEHVAGQMVRTVVVSNYAAKLIQAGPAEFIAQLRAESFHKSSSQEAFDGRWQTLWGSQNKQGSEALASALRQFRATEMLRLIWRDQNSLCSVQELTQEISYLADTCINAAVEFHHAELSERWGVPRDPQGKTVQLLVIGMGKLGAHELNLSSDIDLIFTYSTAGEVVKDQQSKSHQEFFLSLGQLVVRALDERTADGFAFRVDMRLRPYGDSGALVHSFAALEDYYQTQGRDWERYAMIKARLVNEAASPEAAQQLQQLVRPFVYRRYIDFSVIEALRSMKAMIVKEVKRRGLQNNIKLGAGGIREVEFIAQAFQLVHGGRDKNLRTPRLYEVFDALGDRQLLPEDEIAELRAAYEFLRRVEHAIQAQDDKQTQLLPEEERSQARLAYALGFADWDEFIGELGAHRNRVRRIFENVVASDSGGQNELAGGSNGSPEDKDLVDLASFWSEAEWDQQHALELFNGFEVNHGGWVEFADLVREFKQSGAVDRLQPLAEERLASVMPVLIAHAARLDEPVLALQRVLEVISSILRRSAYLVLLHENPKALSFLVQLCARSVYVTRKLVQHPLLLDELVDPRNLQQVQDPVEVAATLRQLLLRVQEDDTEAQMEQLRYFKRSQTLHLAAAEFSGQLDLPGISDSLTHIAEALLASVLDLAWAYMQQRYGLLPGTSADEKNFLVVAYGKLGGMELSHASDLDLVFIYDAPFQGRSSGQDSSDGEISLDSATYYTRLGQRMIHLLSTRTAMGQVYEIDMRLRPSGNSGLLVSSLARYHTYQRTEAWTWEHQALVRARAVTGSQLLADKFNELRVDLLCTARKPEPLQSDILEMRDKMLSHQNSSIQSEQFDLKHSRGGIVDIEFMVQYKVLLHAAEEPRLCEHTGNIRALGALQEFGFLPAAEAASLIKAYLSYRACLHQLVLQDAGSVVSASEFSAEIETVTAVWKRLFAKV